MNDQHFVWGGDDIVVVYDPTAVEDAGTFEEGKHKRHAKGDPRGGQFAEKPDKPKPQASGLREYVDMIAKLQAGNWERLKENGEIPESVPANLLQKYGRYYPFDASSYKVKHGPQHMCYMNAGRMAIADPDLTYVEGYASVHGVPIEHAWVVDKDGKVLDPTIRNADGIVAYYGVPIDPEFLTKFLTETGYWGVFGYISIKDLVKYKPEQIVKGLKPGKDAFEEGKHKRHGKGDPRGGQFAPKPDVIKVYHGTSAEVLDKILNEGITVQPGKTFSMNPGYYEGERGESVFITTDLDIARRFAIARRSFTVDGIVFEIAMPEEEFAKFKPDMALTAPGEAPQSFYGQRHIKPEWIKGVWRDGIAGRQYKAASLLRDAQERRLYLVVFVDSEVRDATPQFEEGKHERHPKGDPRGGQFTKKTQTALEQAGLNVLKVRELPENLRRAVKAMTPLDIEEPPKIAAQALADAYTELSASNTETGAMLRSATINMAMPSYEPKDANMTTAHDKSTGDIFLLVNAGARPMSSWLEKPYSYAARQASNMYKETRDLEKTYYELSRLSAVHEVGHVLDYLTDKNFTRGFLRALAQELKLSPGQRPDFDEVDRFLTREVSGYSTESMQEASAEAFSKYYNERKLPGKLNDWAQEWLE